jgi:hypothetical protein
MKNILYSILVLAILAGGIYLAKSGKPESQPEVNTSNEETYISYKNSEYGAEFSYPASWGQVTIEEGNKVCPEDDTYRTQDTLIIYDWEYSFPERKLPNSESFMRTGVRTRELIPEKLNDCGDKFLYDIASKKLDPRILSSVQLVPTINSNGLEGFYNTMASRLNTESRTQYTFFMPRSLGGYYALQVYASFVPVFGSSELAELDGPMKGDMLLYIDKGVTASPVREHFAKLAKVADSLKFSGE